MKISEYVSLGHPDKTADFITTYILSKALNQDPKTRYAVEVQVKDNYITLGGEVTTNAILDYPKLCREAIIEIGYTPEYAKIWGGENTIDPNSLNVVAHISKQSNDIKQGVDAEGWGDQGIFFGLAVNKPNTNFLPLDYYYAKTLCNQLYNYAKKNYHIFGLDIKTEIVMDGNNIKKIIVAIPCRDESRLNEINQFIKPLNPESVVINGTGCYIKHSSFGDCGTTGRKISVDFYGGNCVIGGGNLWGKDMTKADVTLNFYARVLARRFLSTHPNLSYVKCSIACCIGKPDIQVCFTDECGFVLEQYEEAKKPSNIINELGLNKNIVKDLCKNGFTSVF